MLYANFNLNLKKKERERKAKSESKRASLAIHKESHLLCVARGQKKNEYKVNNLIIRVTELQRMWNSQLQQLAILRLGP